MFWNGRLPTGLQAGTRKSIPLSFAERFYFAMIQCIGEPGGPRICSQIYTAVVVPMRSPTENRQRRAPCSPSQHQRGNPICSTSCIDQSVRLCRAHVTLLLIFLQGTLQMLGCIARTPSPGVPLPADIGIRVSKSEATREEEIRNLRVSNHVSIFAKSDSAC